MKQYRNRFITAVIIGVVYLLLVKSPVGAHGGFTTPFAGIGISGEYSWYKDQNDKSCYLTLKYGEISFLSYFITADIGHRFNDNDIVYRLGGEAYVGPGVLGFHVGISNKYDKGSGDFYDGKSVSYGLSSALVFNPSLFIIAGQEMINSRTHENYVRISLMYNLRSEIKFRY